MSADEIIAKWREARRSIAGCMSFDGLIAETIAEGEATGYAMALRIIRIGNKLPLFGRETFLVSPKWIENELTALEEVGLIPKSKEQETDKVNDVICPHDTGDNDDICYACAKKAGLIKEKKVRE